MPIYTYRCSNCGVQFEKQQSFSDQKLLRCPECGKRALKKVYLPVGIVFKGSGFYATDHHSPSGQVAAKGEEKDAGKKDSKEGAEKPSNTSGNEKKSEIKPAMNPEGNLTGSEKKD
jgi:putative FmdB family regulatory protein